MDKKTDETIQRPFILEIDEAKTEIVQAINNAMQTHKLPLYIIDMILSELSTQVKEGAKNEMAVIKQQMIAGQEVG